MNWLSIAQKCFRDEHGSLCRGLLTSVFALVVGLQRMFHLDQMEDLGFALLTGMTIISQKLHRALQILC